MEGYYKERIKKMVLLGIKQFGDPYYQGFAAQIAFFIMLSVVPTIIVITQLLGFMNITNLDVLTRWIDRYVDPQMGQMLKNLVGTGTPVGNNIILIIVTVWAASRAQFSMMRIANYTFSGGRTTGNYWRERFRSLRTMFSTIFTIAFVIVVLVYGKQILYLIFGQLVEQRMISWLWGGFRWPLVAVMYFLMLLYNYYVLPSERITIKDLLPGTIFASAGMVVVTVFYAFYTFYIVNYNIIYGSLSSIVALLFWFYFLSWVMVLGILVNKVFRDTKRSKNGSYR